ncbi:hypothetical protein CCP4SC76_1550020 [Gammaproteobacteria bacterium]
MTVRIRTLPDALFAHPGTARLTLDASLHGPRVEMSHGELLALGGHSCCQLAIRFHTSEAHMKYFRELMPFQQFEILVWPRVKRMSLLIRFFFIRINELMPSVTRKLH